MYNAEFERHRFSIFNLFEVIRFLVDTTDKVNQNTIKDYCEISLDNSTKPASIILKRFIVTNSEESHNFFQLSKEY